MLDTRTKFLKGEIDKNPSLFKSSKVKLEAIRPKLLKTDENTDLNILAVPKQHQVSGQRNDIEPSAQLLKP